MVAYHNDHPSPRHVYRLGQRDLERALRLYLRWFVPAAPSPPKGRATFRFSTRKESRVEMVGEFLFVVEETL